MIIMHTIRLITCATNVMRLLTKTVTVIKLKQYNSGKENIVVGLEVENIIINKMFVRK